MTSLETLAPRIVVLCGSLRAGTTLLRILLGRHADLTGRGESDYLFEKATPAILAGGGTAEERAALTANIANHRIPRAQNVTPPTEAPVASMIAQMLTEAMPAEGRLLLTLHRHADVAAAALPGAAFIRLRRDPRDVAISSMKMGWAGNPYYGVDVWRQAERDWYAAEPFITGPQTQIAFEAMTADPKGELSRVLGDIGLSFDDAVLQPEEGSTYGPPSPDRNYAWKGVLSAVEAAELDWRISDVPDDGFYDRSPAEPGAMRKAQLFLANKAGRQAFAIDRFGLPLQLASLATRRLPIPGGRVVQRRIDAVNIAHLK